MKMEFTNIEECDDEGYYQIVEAFCDKFWAGLVSLTYTREGGKLEPAYRFSDNSEYYNAEVLRRSLWE